MTGNISKLNWAIVLVLTATATVLAQTDSVIPLKMEPHHHLAFHNEYVNVYQVQVKPHDAVKLHRHDYDAISVMLDGASVTVHAPDKPDVHQELQAAQVRLQPKGYVHQTSIDGDKLYRNVTIELLKPQENDRNLCAQVISGQPLHCEESPTEPSAQPQLATDQTAITLRRVPAENQTALGNSITGPELIIAVDSCTLVSDKGKAVKLKSGDFAWLDKENGLHSIKNETGSEARFVLFSFKN
jgi:quercetin dioxygenase-like cupin family protein